MVQNIELEEDILKWIIQDKFVKKIKYRNTLCHFPPKSDDFTDFCEGENDNGQQKNFLKNYFENFIKII